MPRTAAANRRKATRREEPAADARQRPPAVHPVLAMQRSAGNHATAALLARMKDIKAGTDTPLVGVETMSYEQLEEIVRRIKEGELVATPEETERIRSRLLDIRQQLLDAEIQRLEREINQLEIEVLEDEIADLEREIREDEERERKLQEQTVNAPPSTPQLVNIVATPKPSSLNPSAATFKPSILKPTAAAFKPKGLVMSPPAVATVELPPISEEEFKKANTTGKLTLRAVKWWSSKNFPNHNIEIMISIGGRQWAIAHVKWRDRNGPDVDNVDMATFKAPDGKSIYGGNIWAGTVRDLLVAEALKHKAKAPPASSGHNDVFI